MTTLRKSHLLAAALTTSLTMAVVGLWASPAFASSFEPTSVAAISKKVIAGVVLVVVIVAAVVAFLVVRRNQR
jgi:hypothetical protein